MVGSGLLRSLCVGPAVAGAGWLSDPDSRTVEAGLLAADSRTAADLCDAAVPRPPASSPFLHHAPITRVAGGHATLLAAELITIEPAAEGVHCQFSTIDGKGLPSRPQPHYPLYCCRNLHASAVRPSSWQLPSSPVWLSRANAARGTT